MNLTVFPHVSRQDLEDCHSNSLVRHINRGNTLHCMNFLLFSGLKLASRMRVDVDFQL